MHKDDSIAFYSVASRVSVNMKWINIVKANSMAPELSKIFFRLVIGYYSPIFRANYKDIPLESMRRPKMKPEDWKAD